MLPPSTVLPDPTDKKNEPPLPFVETPVSNIIFPLLPTLAVPVLKLRPPETPFVPALTLRMIISPLERVEP
jgi:hypothetical protein